MTERKDGDEVRAILKKSSDLGAALMMSRKEGESPTGYLRTYEKPLLVDRGRGTEVFTVQDTGLTDGKPSERFSVGVSLDNDYWRDLVALDSLVKDWGALVINQGYGFAKRSLKAEGYGQIYDAVGKLEEEGFFKGRLEKLIERYRFGRRMADLAAAEFRKRINGYEGYLDRFDEQAAVYFYGGRQENKKPVKAVRIRNFTSRVEVEVGRVRIDERGTMDAVSFDRFKPHTVWFPVGEAEVAEKQVSLALTALGEYLA